MDRPKPKPSKLAIASLWLLLLGFLTGIFWVAEGPPLSVETRDCVLLDGPETQQSRRSISHSVETSCGKLSIRGYDRWQYGSLAELGGSYRFTIEHRLFSQRVVSFEAIDSAEDPA